MTDDNFSNFLLGRLSSMEERLRAQVQAEPVPSAPAPVPVVPREPSAAEQNAHFLANLEEIAGVKPQQAAPMPATPPATLSRAHPRFAHEFAKHAAGIASGTCEVVD